MFDVKLYENYLKDKNYHLCVFTKNEEENDLPILFYDLFLAAASRSKIKTMDYRKIILFQNKQHFDIVSNLSTFLYGDKSSEFCSKCFRLKHNFNHTCCLSNFCCKCLCCHTEIVSEENKKKVKCPLCNLYFFDEQCLKNHYLKVNTFGERSEK